MKIGKLLLVLRWVFGVLAVALSLFLGFIATAEWDSVKTTQHIPYLHIMSSDLNGGHSVCKIDFDSIVHRRQLKHVNASALLRAFWEFDRQQPPYNNATDLIVFEHPMKTGGTSLSFKLDEMFGEDAIVPGSDASGFFDKTAFDEDIKTIHNDMEEMRNWWRSKKAMYSHSHFQDWTNFEAQFESWFLDQIPKDDNGKPMKRIYLMSLYREPIEYLASNMFEWMCRLGSRMREAYTDVNKKERNRKMRNPMDDPDCLGLRNLTFLADHHLTHTFPKTCRDAVKKRTFRKECKLWKQTGEDPMPHCRSAEGFVNHTLFQKRLSQAPEPVLSERGGAAPGESVEDVEKRALARFGGLEPMWSVPLRWIGLTERYDELLLLLYDWMNQTIPESLGSDIKRRFKSCRPSSFWSSKDQQLITRHVWKSKVVHNVVNAIIDVRISDWCCRRQQSQTNPHPSSQNASDNEAGSAFQRFCSNN